MEVLLPRGGGALNFFSGRGVRPGFPKCGACERTFASEKGGLWAENFQIWRLVSWKFPNLEACELKISKFGGLWAKIWVKIEAVEAKISKFSQKGVLWTDSFAWNGTLASGRRGVKRGSSGPHIAILPFWVSAPPRITSTTRHPHMPIMTEILLQGQVWSFKILSFGPYQKGRSPITFLLFFNLNFNVI